MSPSTAGFANVNVSAYAILNHISVVNDLSSNNENAGQFGSLTADVEPLK